MISAIVATAMNRVIGKQNDLPWYLPSDLKRFKELTTGHTVVMGRKTHDSIIARIGKPLPNRRSIVLTRDGEFQAEGAEACLSVEKLIQDLPSDQEVFVIGGEQIYEALMPYTDRIYATEVNVEIDGDAFFPEISAEWREISREAHTRDEKNEYDYSYVTYEREKLRG